MPTWFSPTDYLTNLDFEQIQTDMEEFRSERIAAFCMAGHQRLGVKSQAHSLPNELFHMIGSISDEELEGSKKPHWRKRKILRNWSQLFIGARKAQIDNCRLGPS